LFPFARRNLRGFLRRHANRAEVAAQLHEVARLEGRQLTSEDAADILERWIDQDRKATPLKALQGMIWRGGYESGEIKGHVYPDTPAALKRWHARGLKLYVYSSGSVEAQQLIFAHTDYGDLTPLFSGYFDTRIGGKREAESYKKILGEIGQRGEDTLFLSDIGEELDAAKAAAMRTCQLLRDASARPAPGHPQARVLTEIAVA
jgi:enolase-phosphatase E1